MCIVWQVFRIQPLILWWPWLSEGHKRVTAAPTLRKEPITADILLKLLGSHGHSNATLADLRTLFISFISYAGFLRFDDLIKITRKDCSISQDCLSIHITKSKNDQLRQGSEVFIARTFRESCPVAIAERYFAALGDPADCALPLVRRLTKTKRGLIPTSHPLSRTRTRESVLNAIKPFVPDIKSYSLHKSQVGRRFCGFKCSRPTPSYLQAREMEVGKGSQCLSPSGHLFKAFSIQISWYLVLIRWNAFACCQKIKKKQNKTNKKKKKKTAFAIQQFDFYKTSAHYTMFVESQVNENLISTGFNWTLDSTNEVYICRAFTWAYMNLIMLNPNWMYACKYNEI